MKYWLVRGSPAENGDFAFIQPGDRGHWRTKQPPRHWKHGDRLLFWASSPRRELIALGEFEGETGKFTSDGEVLCNVHYLTPVVARPITMEELRNDSVLAEAIFLKKGPAASVLRLTIAEGEHLYRLLGSKNEAAASIWPDVKRNDVTLPDIDDSAIEGEARLVSHLRRERRRSLVESKKNAVLAATGTLACEVCGFDFGARYGALGEGFCEVHHKKPLAEAQGASVTSLADLAVVCSNCHRIIHRSACALSVEELKNKLTEAQQVVPADGPRAARSARR